MTTTWVDVLDTMERDLARASGMLAHPSSAGSPAPEVTMLDARHLNDLQLGALPRGLVPRARAIAERQAEVLGSLRAEAMRTHQELALLDRIGPDAQPGGAVFLDRAL